MTAQALTSLKAAVHIMSAVTQLWLFFTCNTLLGQETTILHVVYRLYTFIRGAGLQIL